MLNLICLLALPYYSCFAQIDWEVPTMISTSDVNASDPQIVTDVNGNVSAVWVENGVIQTSSMPTGGNWGTIVSLSNPLNTSANPRLKMDGSGNAVAVWIENGVVTLASLPTGGSWSAEIQVSNNSGGATSVAHHVDSLGNIAVVWERNGFIESSQFPASLGSWSSVSQLSTNGAEDNPEIHIGEDGTIAAVWHSVVSGNDNVYAAIASVNGAWGPPLNVISSPSSGHNNYPHLIVDPNGDIHAVWYHYSLSGNTYSNVVVLSSTLTSGTTSWPLPTILSGPGMANPAELFLRLAIDSNGDVIAVWVNSYDGSTFAIEASVLPLNGSWAISNLLALQNPYSYQCDVSATSLGVCVASLMYFDGTNIDIQSMETSINGVLTNFWTIPSTISQGTSNDSPRVSAQYQSSNGNIYAAAVWVQNNGTNNVIQATVGTETAVAPPTNLSVVQNSNDFGVFTEYFNQITWTDSTGPNVVQYILYRNGVACQTAVPGTMQFIDHNAVENQSINYGVAAVNNSEILSQIQPVFLFPPPPPPPPPAPPPAPM